ncbi:MAG: 50S ribosomal protein L25/general stress protein Ctc [Bacteroidaceae bacterium]|jgi:large subunit ribosomal protein L25|nr:50S ribosomal protein L25/general stress protein Ctc [Bacteroidaceae bacterium]
MKTIDVKGTLRAATGKKSTRELRKTDAVPCVLYGVEKDDKGLPVATPIAVTNAELRNLVYTPNIYLVNLAVDNKVCKAILKDIQFDPVKDTIMHVDFYQVTEDKPIVMDVPVKLNGLAAGVRAGGKLVAQVRKLKVKALYSDIPEKLDIDVTKLELGKSIKVSELSFDGLELVTPAEVVVCSVRMTRAARGAAATEAEA